MTKSIVIYPLLMAIFPILFLLRTFFEAITDLVICGSKIWRHRYRLLTWRMRFAFVVPCSFYLVRALVYPREQTAIGGDFPFEFSLASFFLIFMDNSEVESVGVSVNADIESQSDVLEPNKIP